MLKLLRRYDLEYWQMREALGFSIPTWVDRRWPRQFQGNAGKNPFECGVCASRRLYPELQDVRRVHVTSDI